MGEKLSGSQVGKPGPAACTPAASKARTWSAKQATSMGLAR